MTSRTLAIAVFAAALVAPDARAQPADDKAAQLYDNGKRHFDIADYPAAIASWKEAYLLSSEPLLLFNIAQAYRLGGDCPQANRFYLNYQRLVPKPANLVELQQAMAKCAGIEPATGDASEGKPVVTEPEHDVPTPPPPIEVPPPKPRPVARLEPVDDGKGLRIAGYATGGVGLVALAIGVASGISAHTQANTISGQANGTVWNAGLAQTQSDGQSAERRMWIFSGVGVAAVVAGGVLWWMGSHRSTRVDVAVTPGHAEVALSCVF